MEEGNSSGGRPSSGYGKPPWIFKGSALYQLHLVKADIARAFVPKNLRLVEAFGYTLGGFFLANYEDSPAGSFDELVVIAGIVWNPPSSCAWAARVLVSSEDACHHGRKEVGLPSHVAKFSKRTMAVPVNQKSRDSSFLNLIGLGASVSMPTDCSDVQVTEVIGHSRTNICNMNLATLVPGMKLGQWTRPTMRLSLPSFSGRTEYNPDLLKYSCDLKCKIRAVQPAIASSIRKQDLEEAEDSGTTANKKANLTLSILLSKPLLALEFSSLEMKVGAPIVVSDLSNKNNSCGTSLGVA